MTVAELTTGVQFTVDQKGIVTAVVITPDLWQHILEALEDAEDTALIRKLRTTFSEHPTKHGSIRWDDVADAWL